MTHPKQALAFADHDHRNCAGGAMKRAEELANARGLRLTPVRRRTLEILLEEHRALGAYHVLERLGADGFGNQPPVAYRALEFLVENGLAHRIRRLNAFAACSHPGQDHVAVFFICSDCGGIAEAPGGPIRQTINIAAKAFDFEVSQMSIEAVGTCPPCREARA